MTAVAKGMWVAFANVVVIAAAMCIDLRVREGTVMVVIVAASIVPAVFLGGVLGKLGEATASQRPFWRFLVLALPACGLVAWLADRFDMMHFVPHACIPTFAAASILERLTRKPPVVPTAVVEE